MSCENHQICSGNTLDNTFKHRNCTNGQVLRSGSPWVSKNRIHTSWSTPNFFPSIIEGRRLYFHLNRVGLVWQPEGIMVVTIDLWETRMDPQGPMWASTPPTWVNLRNISRHPYQPVAESKTTLIVNNCSAAGRVAELNNHYFARVAARFSTEDCGTQAYGDGHCPSPTTSIVQSTASKLTWGGPDRGHWWVGSRVWSPKTCTQSRNSDFKPE